MAPNFPSMMYPTEYTGWCTGMARIFRPWHVTGLWIGITSNERTGFSLVGITRKSGHTRLLKTSLSIASMVSAGPWTTTGVFRCPTSRSVISGTSFT